MCVCEALADPPEVRGGTHMHVREASADTPDVGVGTTHVCICETFADPFVVGGKEARVCTWKRSRIHLRCRGGDIRVHTWKRPRIIPSWVVYVEASADPPEVGRKGAHECVWGRRYFPR